MTISKLVSKLVILVKRALTADGHGLEEVVIKVGHLDVVQVHELVQRSKQKQFESSGQRVSGQGSRILHVVIMAQQVVQVVVLGELAAEAVLSDGLLLPNDRLSHVSSR